MTSEISERQARYLKYLQQRQSPVSAVEIGRLFNRCPENITAVLRPLVAEGLVKRQLVMRQKTVASKKQKAYYYEAVDKPIPPVIVKKKPFQYHNPFNLA